MTPTAQSSSEPAHDTTSGPPRPALARWWEGEPSSPDSGTPETTPSAPPILLRLPNVSESAPSEPGMPARAHSGLAARLVVAAMVLSALVLLVQVMQDNKKAATPADKPGESPAIRAAMAHQPIPTWKIPKAEGGRRKAEQPTVPPDDDEKAGPRLSPPAGARSALPGAARDPSSPFNLPAEPEGRWPAPPDLPTSASRQPPPRFEYRSADRRGQASGDARPAAAPIPGEARLQGVIVPPPPPHEEPPLR